MEYLKFYEEYVYGKKKKNDKSIEKEDNEEIPEVSDSTNADNKIMPVSPTKKCVG